MTRYLAVTVGFIWLGCAQNPWAPQEGTDFALRVGESATIRDAGLIVTFVRVVSDSRCQVDVTCFWSGNGEIELGVTAVAEIQLVRLNSDLEPRATQLGEHELRFVELDPDPRSDAPLSPTDYVATLRVTRR
jgi:hypothetical protein